MLLRSIPLVRSSAKSRMTSCSPLRAVRAPTSMCCTQRLTAPTSNGLGPVNSGACPVIKPPLHISLLPSFFCVLCHRLSVFRSVLKFANLTQESPLEVLHAVTLNYGKWETHPAYADNKEPYALDCHAHAHVVFFLLPPSSPSLSLSERLLFCFRLFRWMLCANVVRVCCVG